MGSRYAGEMGRLLDEAERRGSCAAPEGRPLLDAMRREAKSGRLISPYPHLFYRRDRWNDLLDDQKHLHLLHGLAALHPDWVFCGPSAAVALGLNVSYGQLQKVHAARRDAARHGNGMIVWHKLDKGARACRLPSGLLVTVPERCVCDCLRMMDFREGMIVGDSFLRRYGRTRPALQALVGRETAGLRGAAQARLTAAHADGRAESGGESYARAAMIEHGYQLPDLQAWFEDLIDRRSYRVDFLWRLEGGQLVIGEFDGHGKYGDKRLLGGKTTIGALSDERLRESRLTCYAKVARFGWRDVRDDARFSAILDSFGIPRVAPSCRYDVRPTARPRRDKGARRVWHLDGWTVQVRVVDLRGGAAR